MSSLVPAALPPAGSSQLTVSASTVRLAELAVGQLYRVTVTASYPGKAEILIGNQYLLAATPFRFQPGDVLTLKLAARSSELLQFQLALPAAADEALADVTTLLKAAALPDTAANRSALTTLLQSGVPVTARTMADTALLLAGMPQAGVAAFMPLYKELAERNLRLDKALLAQLARLTQNTSHPPALAAVLAGALAQTRRERGREGKRQRETEAALQAALGAAGDDAAADSAAQLKERIALLYSAPEHAVLSALKQQQERAPEPVAAAATAMADVTDLANLLAGEELGAEVNDALALMQAQRIVNALAPGRLALSLPTMLDDEPMDVQLSLQLLSEQYYHKDYALRVRIENETQGEVEFQLRTRGPGLFVDVLAEDEATLQTYSAQAERFGKSWRMARASSCASWK